MKIFVTVGAQLPFDRLVAEVRRIELSKSFQVIGQTGKTMLDLPENYKNYLDASEYKDAVHECDVIVSHAGMGSIITALDYGKPIIVCPRLAELGEHRNNHQLDTLKHIKTKASKNNGLYVCDDEGQVEGMLSEISLSVDAFSMQAPKGILNFIERLVR